MSEEAIKDSLAAEMARQMGYSAKSEEGEEDFGSILDMAVKLGPIPEPEKGKTFTAVDFDDDFQVKIAAMLIRDESFYRRVGDMIEARHFEDRSLAALVHLANNYHSKYSRLPDSTTWKMLIKDAKAEKIIREDEIGMIVDSVKRLFKAPINDRDFVVDKVAQFAKNQAVALAYLESMELIERGDYAKAETVMVKAFATGAKADVQVVDFWERVDERTQHRRDVAAGLIVPNGITTGIKKLDNLLYHKGWGRKELSCIMGGAKKGKSTALLHFALIASQAGYNVLYETLEVANTIIEERMDANVTGVKMAELVDRLNEVKTGLEDKKRLRRPGKLMIAEHPTGSLTPGKLRKDIEFYKANGIVFDMIVVDYADIMSPDKATSDAIENSKQVWIGLRAIAQEENAAMLTATQTNREGFKADVAKAEHAAEDFNKVRIVDLMITINRSDEERAKGEARLYFAASRNQSGEFTIKIRQEIESMRFLTEILDIT